MKEYRNELGEYHRTDGPAIEDSYSKEWFINDKRHREDGPAVEDINGYKTWYINGKRHREDGPAIENSHGKYWFINDIEYSEDQYHQEITKIKLKRLVEL